MSPPNRAAARDYLAPVRRANARDSNPERDRPREALDDLRQPPTLRRMFSKITPLFVGLALSTALTSDASDWPEFRGPTGQGHSTAISPPIEWSATSHVAWKTALDGEGWSSPALKAGQLYLTSAVLNAGKETLLALCLDAKSGRILWNVVVFTPDRSPGIHQKNGHASPTPIIEGDRLYVHFGHQGTACLDLTGKILWRNTALPYTPVHGNGGSPIIVDDLLVFSGEGDKDPFVVALDKATGTIRWKTARVTPASKKFSFSTPLLITVAGQKQVISPGSGAVCAYDPKDGKELWRVRYGEGYSVIPRPVFGHGLIFIGTGYDRPSIYAIRVEGAAGDVTDTRVAWKLQKGAPNTPSLLLVGDELYAVSDAGIASCLDAKTGAVHWQERIGGDCSASPVFAGGRIYLQNETGTGVVLQPGRVFRKLAENPLNERTLASYAVDDGAFYIRGAQHLFKITK